MRLAFSNPFPVSCTTTVSDLFMMISCSWASASRYSDCAIAFQPQEQFADAHIVLQRMCIIFDDII
ncbi:MAG: hypothetical protein WDO16_05995 [Bacteroidota bacterium]